MPAYEGEDHWTALIETGHYGWKNQVLLEQRIRRLGRNLAIAGALAAAYEKGFMSCRLDCAHRDWD